ncbi:unnamed protein product [Meloidogyne enterolobii]|uniref:Uncharacterized protein n=1 Tax=Meloidogyne enterolobii TaxID=390850 RepID=A0ACB1B3B5_MELEN
MANISVNGVDDLFVLKEKLNSIREEINLLRWPPKEQQNQNAFFHCFMALFIFLMQCGFAFLEAGAVRAKNITNILTKNVLDSLITIISYWSVGWALAYGPNANEALSGLFGWSQFLGFGLDNFSRFFFQYVFAARASTIISGAVAERAEFTTFLAYSLFVPAIVYPILTHWGWSDQGWLARGIRIDSSNYHTTYMDFAGAGVVHLCGGVISLVAAWMIGPRAGRFSPNGHATRIEGHSVPLASLGGFILMLGFLAFNGGSAVDIARPGSGQLVAKAMVITLICGAFAAIVVLIEHKLWHDKWTVLLTMNGCLTGMISSCAGCNQMEMWGTVITGMGGGLFYIGFSKLLLKLRIDDTLDAFAVHAGGGLWGLISVCIVSNQPGRGLIYALFSWSLTTILHAIVQFGWQLLAAIVIILWSGLLVIPLFGFLKLVHKFRVPADIERKGIDIWKHGEDAYPLVAYGHGWDEMEGNIEQMINQHEVEKKLKDRMQQHPSTNSSTSPRYVATIWHDPDKYGTLNRRKQNADNGQNNGVTTIL